jgi:hypothetical protein
VQIIEAGPWRGQEIPMQSVLSKATIGDVKTDPFPHLVIEDALDASYYNALMSEFPTLDVVNQGKRKLTNNDATFMGASDVLASSDISSEWKHFFRFHTSMDFLAQAMELVGKRVAAIHPAIEPIVSRVHEYKLAIADSGEKGDLYIQCQFGMNSTVRRESSVRTAHIDNPKKIFNALLYCRDPQDDSEGGDLVLYRFRDEPGFYGLRTAMGNRIAEVAQIPYAANTLVLFANSINSVHGVTPRKPTPHVRRYINFQVELEIPIFEIPYVNRVNSFVERMLAQG